MPEKKNKTRRSPRVPLSRPRVLATALAIADSDGIEGLSMRKIALALRVEAMSLYNHVANKDEILDGLVELVVSEIVLPVVGNHWRNEMEIRGHSSHRALTKHPWAAMLLMSRVNIGPAMLAYVDASLGCLLSAGFSYPAADHAWNTLDSFIYGFTLQSLNFPFEPDEYQGAAEEFAPQLAPEKFPHLAGLSEEVIQGRYDGRHDLDFGLALVLDGLERMLDSSDTN